MLMNHNDVIAAIHQLRETSVTWPSQDGGQIQVRRCAPMDYGLARISKDGKPRYHFWDLESPSGKNHNLSLRADQISDVTILDTIFDPDAFVTWTTNWVVPRNTWGRHN